MISFTDSFDCRCSLCTNGCSIRRILHITPGEYFSFFGKNCCSYLKSGIRCVCFLFCFICKICLLYTSVKDVTLVPKPILAAIGSGIDVDAPCGNMVIDIGASTTEISVISLGGIVTSRLLPYGGDQIDEWIRDYVKKNYKLAIGTRSARHLKLAYAKIEDKDCLLYTSSR